MQVKILSERTASKMMKWWEILLLIVAWDCIRMILQAIVNKWWMGRNQRGSEKRGIKLKIEKLVSKKRN